MTISSTANLDDLIADVIRREEAGEVVDRQVLYERHADLADELQEFFSDRDEMARLARPVSDRRRPIPARVRYFGDYELLAEIGAGGMGLVYKARQSTLNRIVAVKMIAAGHLASEEDLRRFRTEAEAAASLQHPGIVAVHEVGVFEGRHYFSMDYIEGHTLGDLVRERPLPAREAARYVRDVAEAVHAAHRQGILHRDLKPSNVLVDNEDRVRVTDFGLATWQSDPTVTGSGSVIGTPSYMPPEQAQGKRALIGPSSDVYSLGAVLYHLLTGHPPFQAENVVQTLRQVVEREPVSPRVVNPAVPLDLETICLKCLEKEPHRRYATAEELFDDLQRYLGGHSIHARPVGRPTRLWKWCRRNPATAVAVPLATMAACGLVAAFVYAVANGELEKALAKAEEAERVQVRLTEEARRARDAEEDARRSQQEINAELDRQLDILGVTNLELDAQRKRAEALAYANNVRAAFTAWSDNDVARTRKLLELCPEPQRNWEWHYLRRLSNVETRVVRSARPVEFVHLFDDGTIVALRDGRVRAWAPDSDEPTDVVTPELGSWGIGSITALAVSRETGRMAAGTSEGAVILWKKTGSGFEVLWSERLRDANVRCIDVDGDRVLVGGSKGLLAFVDAAESEPLLRRLAGRSSRTVRSVCLAPGGRTIAYAFDPDEHLPSVFVRQLDSEDVESLPAHLAKVNDLEFSRGRTLVTAHEDRTIRGWSLDDLEREWFVLGGHAGSVNAVRFDPSDFEVLYSCSNDRTIRKWRIESREQLAVFRGHESSVTAFDLSGDGATLVSCGEDRAFRVWQTERQNLATVVGFERLVIGIAFRSDDRQLLANLRSHAAILDPEAPGPMKLIRAGESTVYSNDGRAIDCVQPGFLMRTDVSSGKTERRFGYKPPRYAGRIATDRRCQRVAFGAADSVLVCDARTGDVLQTLPVPEGAQPMDVAFTPDGTRLAVALNESQGTSVTQQNGRIVLWDLETETVVRTFADVRHWMWDIEISPDGRFLAAATGQYGARNFETSVPIWDLHSGELKHDLRSHRHTVWSVGFSPDSRRMATGSGCWLTSSVHGELKIWDPEYGLELLDLPGHEGTVMDLEFSHDGTLLATGSDDRKVRFWNARPQPLPAWPEKPEVRRVVQPE